MRALMLRFSFFFSLQLIFLCFVNCHFASSYDVTTEFPSCGKSNPSGVWSFGYINNGSPLSSFQLYALGNCSPMQCGGSSQAFTPPVSGSSIPNAWKNSGSCTSYGVPSGFVSLHPGFQNQKSIARFTSPMTNFYNINVKFFPGDAGNTDAAVYIKGNLIWSAASTNTYPSYISSSVLLNVGETVDAVVGFGLDNGAPGDNTPITFEVTSTSSSPPTSSSSLPSTKSPSSNPTPSDIEALFSSRHPGVIAAVSISGFIILCGMWRGCSMRSARIRKEQLDEYERTRPKYKPGAYAAIAKDYVKNSLSLDDVLKKMKTENLLIPTIVYDVGYQINPDFYDLNKEWRDEVQNQKIIVEEENRKEMERKRNEEIMQRWIERRPQLVLMCKLHLPQVGPDFDEFASSLLQNFTFAENIQRFKAKDPNVILPPQWLEDIKNDYQLGMQPKEAADRCEKIRVEEKMKRQKEDFEHEKQLAKIRSETMTSTATYKTSSNDTGKEFARGIGEGVGKEGAKQLISMLF